MRYISITVFCNEKFEDTKNMLWPEASIEEHTMQWLSENEQNDNQWSRKYCGMSFIGQHEPHWIRLN